MMLTRYGLFVAVVLAAWAFQGCTEDPPDPVFVGGDETDGDGDADTDIPDGGTECTGEEYPCGPYGHEACEVIEDISFVASNSYAEDLAGGDGILSLSDVFADESVVGVLLYGTAGWCPYCIQEGEWLNTIYEDFQDIDGEGHRIEVIAAVFQNESGAPATARYGEAYADRYDLVYPTVADTTGDVLYYFDSQGAPGNILIDATDMRIFRIVTGFDRSAITGALNVLDGSVDCR